MRRRRGRVKRVVGRKTLGGSSKRLWGPGGPGAKDLNLGSSRKLESAQDPQSWLRGPACSLGDPRKQESNPGCPKRRKFSPGWTKEQEANPEGL